MNKRMARLLRSPTFLLVLVVVMIAAVGIVYAHWSTTAEVRGNVDTGNVAVGWADHYTDDDGWVYSSDFDADDIGGDDAPDFDSNENSSADPMMPGPGADRYTKDVAGCHVGVGGDETGQWLEINAWNTYPSYYCTAVGQLVNQGSVPIKAEPGEVVGVDRVVYDYCYESWTYYPESQPDGFPPEVLDRYPAGSQYAGDGDGSFIDVNADGVFVFGDGDRRILPVPPDQVGLTIYGDHFVDDPIDNGEYDVDTSGVIPGFNDPEPEVFPSGGCVELSRTPLDFWDAGGGEWHAGLGAHEVTIGFNPAQCGFQLDPGFDGQDPNTFDMEIWMHVEQDALQNVSYQFRTVQPFRNWNEFSDVELCQ